jgi:hypothetical protein
LRGANVFPWTIHKRIFVRNIEREMHEKINCLNAVSMHPARMRRRVDDTPVSSDLLESETKRKNLKIIV